MVKNCNKCNILKSISEFNKNKTLKSGISNTCKECASLKFKKWYNENKNEVLEKNRKKSKQYFEKMKSNTVFVKNLKESQKKYYEEKKTELKVKRKIYYEDNKDNFSKKRKQHYLLNKEIENKSNKLWRENNREKINEKHKLKRITSHLYRLKCNLRTRISIAIKNKSIIKSFKLKSILGIEWNDFFNYIENKFDSNMKWDNYGSYWHIDHIIPLAIANTEQDLIKLCNYKNLQPLSVIDNLKKGAKINYQLKNENTSK